MREVGKVHAPSIAEAVHSLGDQKEQECKLSKGGNGMGMSLCKWHGSEVFRVVRE